MNFVAMRRGVFRSLVAFLLAFAPISGFAFSDSALAAPKGKAAAGKRSAAKHTVAKHGGQRHAWHKRSRGERHAKRSRGSRHQAPPQDETDAAPTPVASPAAKPASIDNSRAVVSLVTSGVASARIAS